MRLPSELKMFKRVSVLLLEGGGGSHNELDLITTVGMAYRIS